MIIPYNKQIETVAGKCTVQCNMYSVDTLESKVQFYVNFEFKYPKSMTWILAFCTLKSKQGKFYLTTNKSSDSIHLIKNQDTKFHN